MSHINIPPVLAGPTAGEPSPLHAQNHGFLIPEVLRAEMIETALAARWLHGEPDPEFTARREAHPAHVREAHALLLADLPPDSDTAAVLALHAPNKHGVCEGCNAEGWEAEPPEWPCTTYRLLAERHGRVFAEDGYLLWMHRGPTINAEETTHG